MRAREAWNLVGSQTYIAMDNLVFEDWLKHMTTSPHGLLLCAVLWWIWRARNEEVLDQQVMCKEEVWKMVSLESQEFAMQDTMSS